MGGLFRVCLPQRCAAWNHPKRWEVARGDGFDPSATKWFFLQQAVTRLVPWLFTTSLGAPNSRVWRITHRDATEFRRGACRSLPEPAAVHIQSFWCHRILESPLSQKGCGTLDQVYGGLENWVFFYFRFFFNFWSPASLLGASLFCPEALKRPWAWTAWIAWKWTFPSDWQPRNLVAWWVTIWLFNIAMEAMAHL